MAENPVIQRVVQGGQTAPSMQVPRPTARLTVPVPRPQTANVRITPVKVPKLQPIKLPGTIAGGKQDKGLFDRLTAIPSSAIRAIGQGVSAIPQFVGKAAQTAYGLGEGIVDLGLDLIDEDIYKSRFETDLERGRELGLKGDALVAYAGQRQYPLGSMIIQSGVGTGRRFAEVATAGKYNYGEPGIDYARAFREGNLGALAVEDIGNVIMAGRAVGAGNLVARAGQAIPGRTGRLVATTGRLIEEPVATTTRGVARVVGGAADQFGGRLAPLAGPAERIAQAERPIRRMVTEISDSYRAIKETTVKQIDADIATKRTQIQEALDRGDVAGAQAIEGEITQLNAERGNALAVSPVVRAGRAIVRAGTIGSERVRQNMIYQFNRLVERGAAPETVERYRAKAERLTRRVERTTDPAAKARLQAEAEANTRIADLKERFPNELGQGVTPTIQEAAIHVHTGKARELLIQAEQGATPEQLVRAATDPTVGPDLANKGMKPTVEGVLAAIEYERSRRGIDTTMNPGQVFVMDSTLALLDEWSKFATDAMARGQGMPEGPAPWYWFQTYPIPEYFLKALSAYGKDVEAGVFDVLDTAVVVLLEDVVARGTDPDIFATLGVDPETPLGAWRKLAEAGQEAVRKGQNPIEYQVAYYALQASYRALNARFPDLMLNPDIYPATMRPVILTRRQAVRRVTGEDVMMMADQAMNLARDYNDLIPGNVLEAIARDIGKAVDPRQRITRQVWDNIRARLQTVQRIASERADKLRLQEQLLTEAEQATLAQLDEIANTVYAIETRIDSIMASAPPTSPRLLGRQKALTETQTLRDEAQAQQVAVEQAMNEAEAARQPSLEPIRQEAGRLQGVIDERGRSIDQITTEVDRLSSEAQSIESDLRTVTELQARGLETVDIANELQAASTRTAEARVGQVTDKQARAQKAADVKLREDDVYTADGEFKRVTGDSEIFRGYSPDSPAYGVLDDFGSFTSEDYLSALADAFINRPDREKLVAEFLDNFTKWDDQSVETIDEKASNFSDIEGRDISMSEWVTIAGRAYLRLVEAEEALAEAKKKPLRTYKEEMSAAAQADYSNFLFTETLTGLTADELRRVLDLYDPESRAAAEAQLRGLRLQVDQLRQRLGQENESLRGNRQELEQAKGLLGPRPPAELSAEQRRLREQERAAQRAIPGLKRQLTFARKAEPREAIAAERRGLAPVVDVRRPAAGAEGPTTARLRRGLRRGITETVDQLERQQAKTVTRIKKVREQIAAQEELATAAGEAAMGAGQRRVSLLGSELPLGPELFRPGERPGYLPAGPARGMLPQRDVALVIRGEGAAPQTRLQAAQQRVSGAIPLTLEGTAARINEFLGQMYRNSTVEQIIRDSRTASTVKNILTIERYDQLKQEAERAVDAQNIDRTSSEYNAAVSEALGNAITRELDAKGYEIVSPVKVDPETGAHAPVGDLTRSTPGWSVDSESIVMRKGVAARLFSEFESKGSRQVPQVISRTLEGLGNLTAKWKSHILPISLRWQIGDAVGIVMFAWLRGDIPPRELIARINEVVGRMTDPNDPRLGTIFFSDLLDSPLADPVLAAGLGNALQARGLRMEERSFIERYNEKLSGERPEIGRFRRYDQFRQKAFRVNEAINTIGRMAVYLENLDRILTEQGRSLDEITAPKTINDPAITEAIRQAVDATNQTLGAFSDLTPWEKQVMRQVFPFWSWIKFINKAAFELAIDQPDRVLFYAHLGSMAADPDNNELMDWLRGKTPILGGLYDLNFLNPYQDAFVFKGNPLTASAETFTSISPALSFPATALGELYYAQTGRSLPVGYRLSRPGYLEGRPEATTRTLGDVLGGIGYVGLTQLGGPLRNVLTMLPEGTVPGTDVATGPVQRFNQGSLRTTGAFAEPRLGPVVGRLAALGRTFGVPAPLIEEDMAKRQAAEQRQRDAAAKTRRAIERKKAGA